MESGEAVVLTVHGRPVADIVPRETRSERRPTQVLLAELDEVAALAQSVGVTSNAADFDVGLITNDMFDWRDILDTSILIARELLLSLRA